MRTILKKKIFFQYKKQMICIYLFFVDMGEDKNVYNDIPVAFCNKCLSLRIKAIDINNPEDDYWEDCGSTDIGHTDIFDWEEKYKEKYNINF